MRLPGSKAEAPALSADFSNSANKGLQMGQNFGTMEASFYSDAIQGINIAAGASVFMGERKTVEDKIIDALIAENSKNRQDIRQADRGTCEWIFNSAPFRNWIQRDPSATAPLYIYGTPGSGKSVLLKFLVKDFEKRLRTGTPSLSSPVSEYPPFDIGTPGKAIAVACFCDDRDEHRQTPLWILRTLLYRLFQQNRNLVKHVQKHIQNTEGVIDSDPDEFQSLDVLQKILEELIPDAEVEIVYFFVDGLDQCGPHLPAVIRLINDLSVKVNGEATKQGQNFSLRWVVSDRGSNIVRNKMIPEYTIDMPKDNKRDIDWVTECRVKRIQEYRNFSDKILHSTTDLLKQNSRGMFMWLSLVLDDLGTWEGVWTENRIKERLHSIPSDVATFYKELLDRQARDSVKSLQTLLAWVYLAGRPMSLQELHVVLTLEEEGKCAVGDASDDEIKALRSNIEGNFGALFAIRSEDCTVHLSHQSVKGFLAGVFSDEGEKEYPRYGMTLAQAHQQISSKCLAYLQAKEVQQREVPKPPVTNDGLIDEKQLQTVRQQYLEGLPLLRYSIEFVGHHLRQSRIEEETDLVGLKDFFAVDSIALSRWAPAYDLLKRWTTGKYSGASSSTSLLFVAARLNLPWLADRSTSWTKYTSLPSAICAPDMSGWSAIHIAADSESVEMVAWLLKNGAMVDAETLGVPHPGRTALHLAVSKRSSAGPEMVKELLKAGARPTVQTRQGGNTPLHYAIDGRSVEIVKALLDAGADPNAANSSGLTPLHKAAAIPGLELVVETLLQGGANPDKRTSVGAVSAARGLSSLKASRDLWETYYAVNTSHTALHIATKARDTERTVETLLKGGADPTLQDSSGRTPLHIAVVRMEPEVVTKMLIESRCNVNARDRDEKTPLMVLMTAISLQASLQPQLVKDFQASRERLIDVLLSAGADTSAEGKDKESPLSCAKQANLSWALDRLTNGTVGNDSMEAMGCTSQKDATEPETLKSETEEKPGFLQTQASRWLPRRSKS